MNKILILSIVSIVFVTILPNSFAEKILYKDTGFHYTIILDDSMKEESAHKSKVFYDGKSEIAIIFSYLDETDYTNGSLLKTLDKNAKVECDVIASIRNMKCDVESTKGEVITIDDKKAFQATYILTLTNSDGTKIQNNLVNYIYIQEHGNWILRMFIDGNSRGGNYEASIIESLHSFQSMRVFDDHQFTCVYSQEQYEDIINGINEKVKSKFGNAVSQEVADFVSGEHSSDSFGEVFSDSPYPKTTSIPDKMNDVSKALRYITQNCGVPEKVLKISADYNQNIYDSLTVYRVDRDNLAIQNNPNDSSAWFAKGALLFMLGEYDEALKAYDQAIKIKPTSYLAWIAKGYSLFMLGEYDEALKAYDQAKKIEPGLIINKIRNELLEEKRMFEEIKKKEALYSATVAGKNSLSGLTSLIKNSSPTSITQKAESTRVPDWIKNNAKWWADGSIGDSDFVKGVEYLIKQKIVNIPNVQKQTTQNNNEIPDWIKNNAKWWADGQITEDDFLKGIEFLASNGIIKVN